jgi:osmotically-inducible protein OsmY
MAELPKDSDPTGMLGLFRPGVPELGERSKHHRKRRRVMNPKTSILLVGALMLLLLPGTALAAEDPKPETVSDLWLKARIVTAYTLNEHLNPFKLDVEVKNGVAQLGGTVDSPVERDLAVEIAKGVEGITEVKEDIRIEPGAMAEERTESPFFRTVEDATVTAKVKSKLLWNRNTHGMDIDVSTENGVVTLNGKVASDAQGDLAAQLARNTTGVERVKRELIVAPETKNGKIKKNLATMEAKATDAWITTRVKSLLLFSRETEGAEIEVSTTGKVVTLKGTVTSKEQQDQILKMVGDTVGVKNVRSQLTVEKG